jgi:hypothetical protein
MRYAVCAALIGAGATLITDLWGWARARLTRTAAFDYGLVGRWFVHAARGRFHHAPITASPRAPQERPIGWIVHYLIGIAFAAILLGIWSLAWVRHPTIGPALVVGIGGVLAPFLIVQPGMGFGIAASRAPNPNASRVRSLVTHAVFGVGLYVAGWVLSALGGDFIAIGS